MANPAKEIEEKMKVHEFAEAIKLADQFPENHPNRYLFKIKCHMAE